MLSVSHETLSQNRDVFYRAMLTPFPVWNGFDTAAGEKNLPQTAEMVVPGVRPVPYL
jgi:hypothetical protein